jgi:hypothetical protein
MRNMTRCTTGCLCETGTSALFKDSGDREVCDGENWKEPRTHNSAVFVFTVYGTKIAPYRNFEDHDDG